MKFNVLDSAVLSVVEMATAIEQLAIANAVMAGQVPLATFSAVAILNTENAIQVRATRKSEHLQQLATIASATEILLVSAQIAPVAPKEHFVHHLVFTVPQLVKSVNATNTGLLLPVQKLALSRRILFQM